MQLFEHATLVWVEKYSLVTDTNLVIKSWHLWGNLDALHNLKYAQMFNQVSVLLNMSIVQNT